MSKKIVLFLLLATTFVLSGILSSMAFADTVPVSIPQNCSGGGTKNGTGTYDTVAGTFSLTYSLINCKVSGVTINGTITSAGTIKVASLTTLNVTLNTNLTAVAANGTSSGNITCTKGASGVYNLTTSVLNGNVNSNCSESGNISISLTDLLTVDIPGMGSL